MALLGQGAYGVPIDYSSVGESAWRLAASNVDAVKGAMGAITDKIDERKKYKEDLKTGKELAKAMKTLYPEIAPAIDPYLEQMDNEETPLSQRAGLAKGSADLINAYIRKGEQAAQLAQEDRRIGIADRGMAVNERAAGQDYDRVNQAMAAQQEAEASEVEINQYMARPLLDHTRRAIFEAEARGEKPLVNSEQIKAAYLKSPDEQLEIATRILKAMPQAAPVELREIPFTKDGQPMKGLGYFNPQTGKATLVPVEEPKPYGDGSGGNMLPELTQAEIDGMNAEALDNAVKSMEDGMVLPPKPGITPGASTAPGRSATQEALDKAKLAQIEQATTAAGTEKQVAANKVNATAQRVFKVIEKYRTPDGKPTKRLQDAVGFGEGVMGPFTRTMSPEVAADQQELELELLETDLLNAAKDLKPVSEDEMKMLLARRPAITSPPEVWIRFMNRAEQILKDGMTGEAATAPPTTAADRLRTRIPNGQ